LKNLKKTALSLLLALILASISGCSTGGEIVDDAVEDQKTEEGAGTPVYADDELSATYPGTVLQVMEDGSFILQVREDALLPYETVYFTLNKDTITDVEITEGAQLLVSSSDAADNTNDAIAAQGKATASYINADISQQQLIFEGEVVWVRGDGDYPAIAMRETGSTGEPDFVFNIGPDTVMEVPLEDIQEGDALLVLHSPISTFSIPPQSPAFEVRKIS